MNEVVATMVGVLLASALSAAGFAIVAVVRLGTRVAVLESQHGGLNAWLEKVEAKLDRVIEGLTRGSGDVK